MTVNIKEVDIVPMYATEQHAPGLIYVTIQHDSASALIGFL